ncbi:MAG: septal ring lytic transglycosylase RlpA family protein [Desulfobulbaceae bacterium]|nr:septal ring lytic transglycosylase RlpA family protein [Desulfobulbaceae bacterium]
MPTVTSRTTIFSLLLLTLLLFLSFGCGSKTTTPQPSGTPTKTSKKKTKSKATQRPYVIDGITYYPIPSAHGYEERGKASWYGNPFHGKKTSNGETYNMYGDTAAHKTLPMDTMLLVKNLENGKTTTVRINDRGPFVQERIIDLTYTKAESLGIIGRGTAHVEIIALGQQQEPEEASAVASSKTPTTAKPAKPAKPDIKPPIVPDFDKGNFYVQVGAYVKIENARTLAKAFANRGRDVIIQQYPAAGMNLYRVMVFASTSLAKAKIYEKKLEFEGFQYALLLAR